MSVVSLAATDMRNRTELLGNLFRLFRGARDLASRDANAILEMHISLLFRPDYRV